MKKTVSFLLIFCMIFAMNVSVSAAANMTFNSTTPVTDDYETYDENSNKPFGASSWNSYEKGTHWDLEEIDDEHGNSLCLQAVSDKQIEYNLGAGMGSTQTSGFYKISLDIYPYDNSTTRIFYIRGGSIDNIPVIKFNTSGEIVWLNEGTDNPNTTKIADYKAKTWLNLTVYYDVAANSCSVYVDNTLKGVFSFSNLTGFRTIRFWQGYHAPTDTITDRMSKVAIDNLYIGYATESKLHSNVADGATDIDTDKEFKFYADKVISGFAASIGANALTSTIKGKTASAVLPSKLSGNTGYALAFDVTYSDGTKETGIIKFTTGSGTKRTNALNINFEGVENSISALQAAYGTGCMALGGSDSSTKNIASYYSVYDTKSVNGNSLKIDPEDANKNLNYDFNAILPYSLRKNTVVIEFDRYDTSTYIRGNTKILNTDTSTTKFIAEHAASEIKVLEDGASSSVYVRPTRPEYNSYNEYKFVINYDSTTDMYSYTFYINGILQGVNSKYAENVNIGEMEDIGRLTFQLWGRNEITSADYIEYDNIRISYNTPSISAKVGGNTVTEISSLNAGDTLTASAEGASSFTVEPMLIMAVYKDGIIEHIDFTGDVEWTVPEDISTGNYKIVIMLWDGFENIIPLTGALVID